nr:hypothetical protein [Tanacetum cinerariifolium]
FWTTDKAESINEEGQLEALVDGKKILITESAMRRDLQLKDAEGVDCLPNAAIFEQLTLMGYEKISQKLTFYKAFFSPQWKFLIHTILQCLSSKTTALNEFSSTMASIIICLATNQKFNFSKYIFESMVKNLDNVNKFLMYPRFVQVFLDKQLEGMSSHNRIYVPLFHTKKIFGNMIRVGKGFSGRETSLFLIMVVQAQKEMGKDEVVNKEMDDSLVRAANTASSLEAVQDSGNINKTRSKATLKERGSQGTSSGGGPRCQETIEDTIAQTRSENISKFSNDLLLAGINTPRSNEDSLKLKELMELCTNLQNRVLNLENTKTTQALEIDSLKRKDASKLGRISDIDADEGITLVSTHDDEQMFDADQDLVTLAQALAELKHTKPKAKAKRIAFHKPEESTTITTVAIPKPKSQDKGRSKMIKEPIKLKKKDQIMLDEEVALKLQEKLQAEFDKEQRLARENAQKEEEEEANIALIKSRDDVQAKINADYQLVERLQAKEQQELNDEEKATIFMQLLEKRRKFFAT